MVSEFLIKKVLTEELYGNSICEDTNQHNIVNFFYERLLLEKLLVGQPVTVPELRKVLRNKILNFEFIKLDGEVRPARGTTMMKYIPSEDHPKGIRPSSPKVATFFDIDKKAWRSVSQRSKEIVLKYGFGEKKKPVFVVRDKEAPKEEEPKREIPKEEPIKAVEPIEKPEIEVEPIEKPEDVEVQDVEPKEKPGIGIRDVEPEIKTDVEVKDVEPRQAAEVKDVDAEEMPDVAPILKPKEPAYGFRLKQPMEKKPEVEPIEKEQEPLATRYGGFKPKEEQPINLGGFAADTGGFQPTETEVLIPQEVESDIITPQQPPGKSTPLVIEPEDEDFGTY